ncbi:MAG: hypothetical protein WBC05_03700 [Sedimentisphaerales bacterium]
MKLRIRQIAVNGVEAICYPLNAKSFEPQEYRFNVERRWKIKYQISKIKNVESSLRDDDILLFALCFFIFDFFSIGGCARRRLAYVALQRPSLCSVT